MIEPRVPKYDWGLAVQAAVDLYNDGSVPDAAATGGVVVSLEGARIVRALRGRERYRYVQPRIERLGAGWKVVSPNCSRNVDAAGGDIDIAWLEPTAGGHWTVHLRDHDAHAWLQKAVMFTLRAALELVCHDPDREFWP